MKLLIILFLVLIPISSASSMTRTFNYDGINYTQSDLNITGAVRDITVYLNPTPFDNFDNPGYYVEETIPPGILFVNTNADWYKIVGNKLSMIVLLPNVNTKLYYKLTLPDETKEFFFTGQYRDDNNSPTSISFNRLIFNYAPVFESSSVSVENRNFLPNQTPVMTPALTQTPIPLLIDHPITIVPIESEPSFAFSFNIFYLLIILIPILLYLKFKSDSPQLIKNIPFTTNHLIIRIKNPTNKKIYIFAKTKNIPASMIKITASSKFILPNESLDFNITSTEKVNGSILIYRKDADNL